MNVVLTPSQAAVIKSIFDFKVEQIEAGRDKNILYKYNASAYVPNKLCIYFQNNTIVKAKYHGFDIGKVELERANHEGIYHIDNPKTFEKIAEEKRDFILKITRFGSDGCVDDGCRVYIKYKRAKFII
jgi:hypothetical protein